MRSIGTKILAAVPLTMLLAACDGSDGGTCDSCDSDRDCDGNNQCFIFTDGVGRCARRRGARCPSFLGAAKPESEAVLPTLVLQCGRACTSAADLRAGQGAPWLALGDIDGDGAADLAMVEERGRGSPRLVVQLAEANGRFAAARIVEARTTASSVAIGDVDGDGLLDLVTADPDNHAVVVRRGRGRGDLGPGQAAALGRRVEIVAAADLQGDGTAEILAAGHEAMVLWVLSESAGEGFDVVAEHPLGRVPTAILTTDITSDGFPDVVVSTPDPIEVVILAGGIDAALGPAELCRCAE